MVPFSSPLPPLSMFVNISKMMHGSFCSTTLITLIRVFAVFPQNNVNPPNKEKRHEGMVPCVSILTTDHYVPRVCVVSPPNSVNPLKKDDSCFRFFYHPCHIHVSVVSPLNIVTRSRRQMVPLFTTRPTRTTLVHVCLFSH